MRCNHARWLWGGLPVLALSWLAVMDQGEQLQADLEARTRAVLREAGFRWAAPVFSGREALLLGQAADEAEQRAAAELIATVWGVGAVEDRSGLVDVATNYVWSASLRNPNRLRINGFVPSDQRRREIIGVARAMFPARDVDDRMKLARGAPEQKQWLGGISFALNQLAKLKTGARIELDGVALTIEGEAEDAAAYKSVATSLLNALPQGISLRHEKVVPPMVRPYTWGASHRGLDLQLTGHVPSERQRKTLLEDAARAFPRTAVADRMTLGGGEPAGWELAARVLLAALARLDEGTLELRDEQISITGIVTHQAAADLVRQSLQSELPRSYKVAQQIKARTPAAVPEEDAQAAHGAAEGRAGQRVETAALGQPAETEGCRAAVNAGGPSRGIILFALASAELDPAGMRTLDQLATLARRCPAAKIEISGHADAEGSTDFNQELSLSRVRSVVAHLTKAGVNPSRLSATGYGATRPIAANDTAVNRAKNRRIEFVLKVD